MKTCKKCNISYGDDKKFCKKCGSSLTQEYNIDPKELAKKSVFEEKLKADSLNVALLLEYSQFLYNNLLFKDAVPNLLKILAINENDEQAKELLFKCYYKLNMFSDARDVGKQLLENKKTDISFLEELAEIESQLGNKENAFVNYETILKLQPANTKALYANAILLLDNNDIENAKNILIKLYKEGNRDRIVTIYAGIDKCLSAHYEKAIETLTSCLSYKKSALSDVHNQRGVLYLVYSLCKTQNAISKIDQFFSMLDFDLIKNFKQPIDEEILAKTISEIISIYFAGDTFKKDTGNIQYVINKYINASNICFTKHTHKYIAEIWHQISEIQESSNLLKDAQISLKKATELSPDNTEFTNKLNDVAAQTKKHKKHKKQQKRKTLTIIGSLITLVFIIIISVNLYNRHKENKVWEKVKQQNTYESYGNYLRKYPDNRFSNEAEFFKEEVLWQKAQETNTIEFYDDYLDKYPKGKYINEAIAFKDDAFFELAVKSNNFNLFFEYLNKYPSGKHFNNAKNKIENLILQEGKGKILFYDDFNEQVLNTNNWTFIDDIKQKNGVLKLEQNVTDKKTEISTKMIDFYALAVPIKIKRKVKIHYASDYYYGYFEIRFNNNNQIKIEYLRTKYYDNAYLPLKEGIYVSSNFGSKKEKRLTNNIWDDWFEEMILFYPISGRVDYFINDKLVGSFYSEITLNGYQSLQLIFNPYGWYTGHYQYIDNIVVSY